MTRKEFIKFIAPLIKITAQVYGYKFPSAIIAQACNESNFGKSGLSLNYNNYFGMKCGSKWKGRSVNLSTKEEYSPGTLTEIRDNFRVYDDSIMGVLGYFDFIQYKRYENLKVAASPRDYLEKIRADGYATSNSYVENCMKIVEQYNLTEWD